MTPLYESLNTCLKLINITIKNCKVLIIKNNNKIHSKDHPHYFYYELLLPYKEVVFIKCDHEVV